MKALVKSRPARGLDLLEVPQPDAVPGEVLVEVDTAGVCGSDVARYAWTRNYEKGAAKAMDSDLPRILGHEFAGTVAALPAGSSSGSGLAVGTRVVVNSVIGCGRCRACRIGEQNLCVARKTLGVHHDGGYAEFVAVPEANVHPLPDDISLRLAAALQPFSVAMNAVRQSGIKPGDRIAVWGLGTIGLATCLIAPMFGATVVAGYDRVAAQVGLASDVGIPGFDTSGLDPQQHLEAEFGPGSIDAYFDAAGAAASIIRAAKSLKKGRPIVLVANIADPFEVDLMPLIMAQQRLVGSRSYSMAAWDQALDLIGTTRFEETLGDRVPIAEAISRFEARLAGHSTPFSIAPGM